MIAEPLHIAVLSGHPLRFFRTPLADGLPDLPWHAVDDLQRCLALNRHGRKIFLALLRSNKRWNGIVRNVATADELVTVAPHFMAQGTIGALVG
jgi:hypothetical protein